MPDAHYGSAQFSAVSAGDELRELLSERQFWVVRRDWKVEDLVLHPVDNQDLGAGFRVSQRYGGPTISYLLYPKHTEHGKTMLGRGQRITIRSIARPSTIAKSFLCRSSSGSSRKSRDSSRRMRSASRESSGQLG